MMNGMPGMPTGDFLASFAAAVWDLDLEALSLIEKAKRRHGVALKTELPGSAMREVVEAIQRSDSTKRVMRTNSKAILNDAELQLQTALQAVHASWDRNGRCRYRGHQTPERRLAHRGSLSSRWRRATVSTMQES